MSDWFTSPSDQTPLTRARAAAVNNLDSAVATAFSALPTQANLKQGKVTYAADTGAADAYVVSLPHNPGSYTDGLRVDFKVANTNTGASTINVNSLGVKTIKRLNGDALVAGDLPANGIVTVFYNTTTGYFYLSPSATQSATAAASSASAAATSASNAASSASAASSSASAAAASATAAAAAVQTHIDDLSDAHDASAISVADAGGYFSATEAEAALQELASTKPVVNWLLNPDGEVAQDLPASSADGDYDFDQWYTITQTGSVAATQLSNPENGYRHGMRLTQSQASAQRMGRCQIIEGKDAIKLRGKTVTFGGRRRLSTSADIRMAILEWTGTEDSPVKDQVNNWTSTNYTAGNFFKSTTLTVAGVAEISMTANTARNASVSATISSSATNIIVMEWTEGAVAQNVTFDAWGARLIEAPALIDYIRRTYAQELEACRRYLEVVTVDGQTPVTYGAGYCISSTQADFQVACGTKRVTPTATLSAASTFNVTDSSGSLVAVTAVSVINYGKNHPVVRATVASGLTAGSGSFLYGASGQTPKISVSARIGI